MSAFRLRLLPTTAAVVAVAALLLLGADGRRIPGHEVKVEAEEVGANKGGGGGGGGLDFHRLNKRPSELVLLIGAKKAAGTATTTAAGAATHDSIATVLRVRPPGHLDEAEDLFDRQLTKADPFMDDFVPDEYTGGFDFALASSGFSLGHLASNALPPKHRKRLPRSGGRAWHRGGLEAP